MGAMSWIHWVLVAGVVTLLFSGGRIPGVMGDFAKGMRAFRDGLKADPADETGKPGADRP